MFYLSRLQFEIEILDPNAPTGFWGTRLRGGYGEALKRELCSMPQYEECSACPRFKERSCDFPYLFKPHVNLFSELPAGMPIGKSINLPAPYVISAPFEIDLPPSPGSRLTFDFAALGKTVDRAWRVIESFGKFGQNGLDVKDGEKLKKTRFQLVDVKDLLGAGRSLHALGNLGRPLIRDASGLAAALLPLEIPQEMIIEFVTPVRIFRSEYLPLADVKKNNQGKTARGLRDFYELVKILTHRIAILWQLYGHDWLGQADFYRWQNALLKQSKDIRVGEMELNKKTIHRFSKSSNIPITMDGFVGAMRVAGDFSPFMELLLLGEILHIGESTAYGFGQFKMVY